MNSINLRCEVCASELTEWDLGGNSVIYRCPSCGHLLRQLNNCFARARQEAWGGNRTMDQVRLYLTYQHMRLVLRGKRAVRVAEIGFGSGKLLERFAKAGSEISGVDTGTLKMKLPPSIANHPQLFYTHAEEKVLPDGSADFLYAIHTMEHLDDPKQVFSNCFDSLAPGGLVYLLTPNGDSRTLSWLKESWWFLEDPTHVRFFTPNSLAIMLRAAGFEVVKTGYPIFDSITCEFSSAMRWLRAKQGHKPTPALGRLFLLGCACGALPLTFLVRFLRPMVNPTFYIVARKPTSSAAKSS